MEKKGILLLMSDESINALATYMNIRKMTQHDIGVDYIFIMSLLIGFKEECSAMVVDKIATTVEEAKSGDIKLVTREKEDNEKRTGN